MTTNIDRTKPIRVTVNDIPCWFNERVYSEGWQKSNPDRVCPICNKLLKIDEPMYMVINNYVLFPNTLIHKSCVESNLEDVTRIMTAQFKLFEEAIKTLISNNKEWARVSQYVAE